jgi:hypothetical protein
MITAVKSQSQFINSITHFPANPTSADTVYFYADVDFPTGNCDEHTQFSGVLGQDVYAGAVHCVGMLTFICNHIDTFKIDPLPAGNYNFTFSVSHGALPSPCNPTSSGATDSVGFIVTSAASVPFITNGNHNLLIFPNPAGNTIKLQMSNEIANSKNKSLVIYSVDGKEIANRKLENRNPDKEINISQLTGGMYFCKLISENSVTDSVKLIVIK